jgi:hypothetical protein
MNPRVYALGTTALLSGLIGAGISFMVTRHVLVERYEKQFSEDLSTAREFYRAKSVDPVTEGEEEIPVEAPTNLENILEDLGYIEEAAANVEFDFDSERTNRTKDRPYILHVSEFHDDDDYDKSTLTYFAEDDVLIDSGESPIPNSENIVGDDNLQRFGHGSEDKRTLYVRNELLEMDFEITLSNGSYAKDVLGFIEHSEKRGVPRRFRRDDG